MPDRESKLASILGRGLPQEVKVESLSCREGLADVESVHNLWLVKAGALDQHREAVLEVLDPQVHHIVEVRRAWILNDERAYVAVEKLPGHLLVQGD